MNVLGLLRTAILNNRSPEWPNLRKEHIKKQPFCQACGSKNNLEVHHIEPVHVNPARELDPENLITLCGKNCHFMFGHLMDYYSWNVNVVQDSQVYLSKVQSRPYKVQKMSNTLIDKIYRRLPWSTH